MPQVNHVKRARKWKLIGRPEPKGEGQRFFVQWKEIKTVWEQMSPAQHMNPAALPLLLVGVAVYVADNSGDTPDDTDDGPCLLVREDPITIEWCMGRLGATANVRDRERETKRVGFTLKEAAWLAEAHGLEVYIDPECSDVLEAHAKLWQASIAAPCPLCPDSHAGKACAFVEVPRGS